LGVIEYYCFRKDKDKIERRHAEKAETREEKRERM
jgi:hypothetical protein